MNWEAFKENENNKRYVQAFDRREKLVLEIDRRKVRYKGRDWLDLSDYDKRKFENKLFIQFAEHRKPLVYLYV